MPAFVVLHDSSLDEICRLQPNRLRELLQHHRNRRTQSGSIWAGHSGRAAAISRRRAGGRAAGEEDGSRSGDFATPGGGQEFRGHCADSRTADRDRGERGRRTGGERRIGISSGVDRSQQTGRDRGGLRSLGLDRWYDCETLKDALPPEITYDEIRLVVARLRREASQKKTSIPA